ncbi:hypothetical protein AMEX_G24223 [Astyanax mexicanus]|uniref:Uncharacterized protein n=1 Tax=Astyanax mexicanus TaxID=7994 RepID=A0A8T2KUS9_ASTMX|nr:hypothetical protein AMEX_G24223 [Astyanax mexicanus]
MMAKGQGANSSFVSSTTFLTPVSNSTASDPGLTRLAVILVLIILCLAMSLFLVLFTSMVLLIKRIYKRKMSPLSCEHHDEEVPAVITSRRRRNKSYKEKINSVYYAYAQHQTSN